MVEQVANALESLEETVEVVTLASHETAQQRTVGAPMPQILEETVEMERGRRAIGLGPEKTLMAFRTARPFRGHPCHDARQGELY